MSGYEKSARSTCSATRSSDFDTEISAPRENRRRRRPPKIRDGQERADLRLADLHRREVRPPALGSMVETDILDAGNGHGIDPTQLAEDLQPGINNDFLARCQEVLAAPVV